MQPDRAASSWQPTVHFALLTVQLRHHMAACSCAAGQQRRLGRQQLLEASGGQPTSSAPQRQLLRAYGSSQAAPWRCVLCCGQHVLKAACRPCCTRPAKSSALSSQLDPQVCLQATGCPHAAAFFTSVYGPWCMSSAKASWSHASLLRLLSPLSELLPVLQGVCKHEAQAKPVPRLILVCCTAIVTNGLEQDLLFQKEAAPDLVNFLLGQFEQGWSWRAAAHCTWTATLPSSSQHSTGCASHWQSRRSLPCRWASQLHVGRPARQPDWFLPTSGALLARRLRGRAAAAGHQPPCAGQCHQGLPHHHAGATADIQVRPFPELSGTASLGDPPGHAPSLRPGQLPKYGSPAS